MKLFLTSLAFVMALTSFTPLYAEAPKACIEYDRSTGSSLVIDGEQYKPSFWSAFSSARSGFVSNKEALHHFDNYISDLRTGQYILWGGIVADLGFLYYASQNPEKFSERTINTIYWGGFLASFLISAHYIGTAAESFHKAINTYNGVYGSNSQSKKTSKQFELFPTAFVHTYKQSSTVQPALGLRFDL